LVTRELDAPVGFQTLELILNAYRFHSNNIGMANQILENFALSMMNGQGITYNNLNISHLDNFTFLDLERANNELKVNYTFFLLACAEGYIQLYYKSIKRMPKNDLQRALRKVFDIHKSDASFEQDILNTVKSSNKLNQKSTKLISEYIGLRNLRNWVAHGRSKVPNLSKTNAYDFDPEDVYISVRDMLLNEFGLPVR